MTGASILRHVLALVAASPDRIAAILDERSEALVAFDARRTILAANEAAERFFGYERRALVGGSTDLVVPERLRQPDAGPQPVLPDITTVEIPALLRSGAEVMTVWTFGAVSPGDAPIFVMIVRAREAMIAELEAHTFTAVFDQAPLPLLLTKPPEGTVIALNRAFGELFEVDPESAIGTSAMALGLSDPRDREPLLDLLAAHGSIRNFECSRRSATGKPLEIALSVTPVRIAGVEHLLTTVQDISLRKAQDAALARAMEQEKEARREAEAANRAKDEFLATISHELRTPLNAILGWATILRQKPRDEARLDRAIEVIERNARLQERLVSDLLDTSRIVGGKLALTLTRASIWEAVNAAADVIRTAAETKGVRLIVDLDPDLPSIVGDAARLQQVFWNLLSNAVRHTPRGGRIVVTADREGSALRVSVTDTGQGIDPRHVERIFERFRQVDSSTTRAHGGLGLGLAIVRHLAEAHGGAVEAKSEGVGKGATFTVTLPVPAVDTSSALGSAIDGELDDVPATKAPSPPPPPAHDLARLRVLVVDDDADARDLLSTVLQGAGAVVTKASSAPEALAHAGPFDLIVSDLGMPGMDGYTFMESVRARATGGPVAAIALSAYVSREHADRALRAGFQEHIAKPVDPAKLLESVRRWSRPA